MIGSHEIERDRAPDGQWMGNRAPSDPVEIALAEALLRASRDGAWDAVQALTDELRARRAARAGVIDLAEARARKRD